MDRCAAEYLHEVTVMGQHIGSLRDVYFKRSDGTVYREYYPELILVGGGRLALPVEFSLFQAKQAMLKHPSSRVQQEADVLLDIGPGGFTKIA